MNLSVKAIPKKVVNAKLTQLDLEMDSIVKNETMTDKEKVTAYLSTLRRYLTFQSQKEKDDLILIRKELQPLSKSKILAHVLSVFKSKAFEILEGLPNQVTWDETGMTQINSIPVGIHISELLSNVVRKKKKKNIPGSHLFNEIVRSWQVY